MKAFIAVLPLFLSLVLAAPAGLRRGVHPLLPRLPSPGDSAPVMSLGGDNVIPFNSAQLSSRAAYPGDSAPVMSAGDENVVPFDAAHVVGRSASPGDSAPVMSGPGGTVLPYDEAHVGST